MARAAKTAVIAARQVRDLLALSPAYSQLPADKQRQMAGDMVKVATYLAEPEGIPANTLPGAVAFVSLVDAVDFPQFVGSLIQGVFQAVVDSSIRQMEDYAKLMANVADTVDQFADDEITENSARDWLATTYPDYLEGDGELKLAPKFDRAEAIKRFRLLPLSTPLRKLAPQDVEKVLVPAARRRIAVQRQQLLATMVMMGTSP